MSESSSPNITFMLQYTEANSAYVDYTNRDEAVQIDNDLDLETHRQSVEGLTDSQLQKIQTEVPETTLNFQEYIDYMNRSYATEKQSDEMTAIFTQDANYLQREKVTTLKEKLEQAHKNGSLLWQGVISFDNDFLAAQGLYDQATGRVDQQAIKTVMRDVIPKMIDKEGLSDSAFWWGNIHLNTDNIHVHFGLSEVQSTREKIFYQPRHRMEYRGNFSQKTIQKCKSDVFHGLINDKTRSALLQKEQLLANLKANLIDQVFQENRVVHSTEKNFLEQAYNHLPFQKKWRYGSNAKDFAVSKFFLDKYLDSYFEHDGKELYQEFLQETRDFLQTYEGTYSAEKNQTYEKIRTVDGQVIRTQATSKGYDLDQLVARREAELRERLANRILRSFRETPPRIKSNQLASNLTDFSSLNQKRIVEQLPEATILKSLEAWQKLGYQLTPEAKAITIIKPVYDAYDKYGNGLGQPQFHHEALYDVSQVEENLLAKQLTLKDLSVFSTEELTELVDVAKQKQHRTLKERQELGTFRYALRLSRLEEKQKELLVIQKLLHQVQPLTTDQAFVSFKQQAIAQELKLIEWQLTPNYKLKPEEITAKKLLNQQFQDSVSFPVSKASGENIQIPVKQLQEELKALSPLQDQSILSFLKGQDISKSEYVEELQTHLSIFQLKHDIYQNNQAIATSTNDEQIKGLKQLNAQHFSTLKQLYEKLLPEEESQQKTQIQQALAKQLQAHKRSQRQSMNQVHGKATLDTSFLRQLTTALSKAQRANQRALTERARSDEREEQEEYRYHR
ncbi:MobP2 family relaxase [Streptococcus sp.]|uniref:MobP2 family relaxase n=1 Tax=Streptococcus sp. TaxID=1306 RepID=UPI002914D080|nr:MobP2 family relaxase [Streptococcus sp.]MDU6443333.1 MobP2 family relaxase [Streptococcus sp.]MDU6639080.1 MobP2 family relaxase [Streptococcus sp.]